MTLAIGMNLSGISYWVPCPFLNRFKASADWQIKQVPIDAALLDIDGYPLGVAPGSPAIGAIIPVDPNAPSYRLRYSGKGKVTVAAGATPTSSGRGEVIFKASQARCYVVIQESDPKDHVRNISVVRTDEAALFDSGETFRPDFIEQLKGFAAIRFLNWLRTNNSTVTDQFVPLSAASYAKGVPIEVCIALANRLGTMAWMLIPWHATDAYILAFRDKLKACKIPPAMELSNEVWNLGFQQAKDAYALAVAKKTSPAQQYGLRAGQLAKLLRGSRYKVVASWQAVQPRQWPEVWAGVAAAGARKADFAAIAPAGYVNGSLTDPKGPTLALMAEGNIAGAIDNIINSPSGQSVATARMTYAAHAAAAKAAGLQLWFYEGGEHLNARPTLATSPAQRDNVVAFFRKIHNDPGSASVMTANLKAAEDAGATLFCAFAHDEPGGENGFFGIYGTPAWDAIKAWIAKRRGMTLAEIQAAIDELQGHVVTRLDTLRQAVSVPHRT